MRSFLLLGCAMPLVLLAGCGGDSGGVASAPTPAAAPTPPPVPPPPPPPPAANYNTDEYKRSNAAVQAQALTAYQAGATGTGVVAAVIDSGINLNSAEFAGKISPLSADLAGSRGLQDEGGHGTAVSGVLLAAKNDSGIQGVAFGATLLVARTDTPGTCTDTSSSDSGCSHNDNAIARGVDLAVTAGARVVNISLGGAAANANLRAAIGRATNAGVIIVISAGNDGVDDPAKAVNPDPLAQIAIDPVARGLVLIAGATESSKTLASFSNKAGNSAAHYLTALGVRVRSNDETGSPLLYSGTSFSAPVVAGAVALLAQAFPALTATQIVDLLLRTTTDLGAPGTDATYGRGEIDLARAFAPQGSLTLPNSSVPVSLTDNGTLSSAMGDAGQGSMSIAIQDVYARDYAVDLASTLARAPRSLRLAAALTDRSRSLSAVQGETSLAVSVAESIPRGLVLSRSETQGAHALAGSMATRIGRTTTLALGFAQSSEALDQRLSERATPAFLVSPGQYGFDRVPIQGFALRQKLGGTALTVSAESGAVPLWQRSNLGPRYDRYRRYDYGSVAVGIDGSAGPLALNGRLSRMSERETMLGARFTNALAGGGATSWFADMGMTLTPAARWRIGAEFRRGWTHVPGGPGRSRSLMTSQSLSFEAVRTALFSEGDSVALRWSEPLRVTSGGLHLIDGQVIALTPTGHERNLEWVYGRPLGPGWLAINSYWRQQPGNFVTAPDDLAMTMRYSFDF